ncbi:ABC transporter substrate-binding protein [Paenibacillus amylolyticus]|nr:ABC transporter substrate-binding protein [Paenibacillus amylolyticus]
MKLNASDDDVTVKIGVQGKGGLFGKAQEQKWFEDAFGELGVKVEWLEFQSGPPMIEAMASNHLDFAGMGNMPPISAQAAGIDFKIISQLLDGKNNVAIIVPKDSPIKNIADLKGKKVAVTKGSNAYNFLYLVLEKAGLGNPIFKKFNYNLMKPSLPSKVESGCLGCLGPIHYPECTKRQRKSAG